MRRVIYYVIDKNTLRSGGAGAGITTTYIIVYSVRYPQWRLKRWSGNDRYAPWYARTASHWPCSSGRTSIPPPRTRRPVHRYFTLTCYYTRTSLCTWYTCIKALHYIYTYIFKSAVHTYVTSFVRTPEPGPPVWLCGVYTGFSFA